MTIRTFKESDIKPLILLWHNLMLYHQKMDKSFALSEDALEQWENFVLSSYADKNRVIIVAEEANKLVGYIMGNIILTVPVFKHRQRGYISDIYVRPDCRQSKTGKMLVQALVMWFRIHEITRIELDVAYENQMGAEFWRKMNFSTFMYKMYIDLEL